MKFDKLYHVWRDVGNVGADPTAADVERILALPRPINLALPFLFEPREVEWHRLFLKFSHGQDPDQ